MARTLKIASLVLAAGLVAAGCASSGSASSGGPGGDTVIIGSLESMTGVYSSIGQGDSGALRLVTRLINANGGFRVAGKIYKLQVAEQNAASDPATAHSEAVALVKSQGAKFLFGPSETPEALAAQPVTSSAGVLWFTDSLGVANSLSEQGPDTALNRYTYSVGLPTGAVASTAVDGLLKVSPGLKTAAIVWPDSASFDTEVSDIAGALRQAGVKVVAVSRFDPATTDFTPILARLRSPAPDVIIGGASEQPVTAIEQQMVSLGFTKTTLFGFGGAAIDATLPSGSPVPFPFVYPTNGGADIHVGKPAVTKLFAEYHRYNGKPAPTTSSFWSMDVPGVEALVAAMKAAGTVTDVAKIQAQLTQVKVAGPNGAFQFRADHLATLQNTICKATAGKVSCVIVSAP